MFQVTIVEFVNKREWTEYIIDERRSPTHGKQYYYYYQHLDHLLMYKNAFLKVQDSLHFRWQQECGKLYKSWN